MVAKVEWHPGELCPRIGYIVTNMARPAERVVAFYNQRGTAGSAPGGQERGQVDAAVLPTSQPRCGQLHALACGRSAHLALPEEVEHWSLTTLREKLVKIGARIVRHGRYAIFQLAEVAVPRALFAEILRRIERLRPRPPPLPHEHRKR